MAESKAVARGYLSVPELAAYSGLSERTLRTHLGDPVRPIPHYRFGSRVLVKPTEFDQWARAFRVDRPAANVCDVVDELMQELR